LYNWILWRDLGKILGGELISSLETHSWELQEKALFKEIVLANGNDRSLHEIIDKIIRTYASQLGEDPYLWGDSTPLNARYTKEIFSAYPKAKYLFLVRDARDVVASYKRGGDVIPFMQYKNPYKCAQNWVNVYQQVQWLQKRTDVFHVRYEALVSDPAQTLKDVQSFIGVQTESLNTNSIAIPDLKFYESPYHSNLKNPVNTKSIGKWKEELSEVELQEVMPIIKRPMQKLGYL
jgi:hypothetical protein